MEHNSKKIGDRTMFSFENIINSNNIKKFGLLQNKKITTSWENNDEVQNLDVENYIIFCNFIKNKYKGNMEFKHSWLFEDLHVQLINITIGQTTKELYIGTDNYKNGYIENIYYANNSGYSNIIVYYEIKNGSIEKAAEYIYNKYFSDNIH